MEKGGKNPDAVVHRFAQVLIKSPLIARQKSLQLAAARAVSTPALSKGARRCTVAILFRWVSSMP
jgi:hypothetical protein